MALKRITFTVGADKTLSPATVQDGGMQGDHKATELLFNFSDELYNHLQTEATKGKLVYRFDGYDGQGGVHHSNTAVLTGKSVTYPLEYILTCYGGLLKVELIISLVNGEESAEVLHTEAAQLKLTFTPYSTGNKSQEHKDLSTLAEIVKDYALRAEKAEQAAAEAQEQTRLLSAAFKSGTTYIFNGGNASGEIDADFIVDGEVSDYSTNAVQNKVIKKYVDDKYPVGSVWVGGKNDSEPIDPSTIFGGTWKLIDKEFRSTYHNDEGTDGAFVVSKDVSDYQIFAIYSGHTIRLRLFFTPKVAFADDNVVQIGQFNFEKIGLTGFYHSVISIPAMSDASNGLVMATIGNTGEVEVNDVIKNTTANQGIYINQEITCRHTEMLDSFCDKFYWQRTK